MDSVDTKARVFLRKNKDKNNKNHKNNKNNKNNKHLSGFHMISALRFNLTKWHCMGCHRWHHRIPKHHHATSNDHRQLHLVPSAAPRLDMIRTHQGKKLENLTFWKRQKNEIIGKMSIKTVIKDRKKEKREEKRKTKCRKVKEKNRRLSGKHMNHKEEDAEVWYYSNPGHKSHKRTGKD